MEKNRDQFDSLGVQVHDPRLAAAMYGKIDLCKHDLNEWKEP